MKMYMADNKQFTPPLYGGLSARVHRLGITPTFIIQPLHRSMDRCALSHPSLVEFNFIVYEKIH